MPEKDAAKYAFNPFDLTKVWLHKDYPLMEVGVLELNRNPEITLRKSNRPPSIRQTSFPVSDFHPTKCCRDAFFPTEMRSAIVWE